MASDTNVDRRVMRLFDGYVHGQINRRQFLQQATKITASATTAAALLASLSPDYSRAQQVDPDDAEISASYKKYASPQGAGVMQGYFVRPAVTQHKLPAVVVVHENRGLNPYVEDVARRVAVAGLIALAPDALTPLGGYPGNDDDGRTLQRERDHEEMVEDFVAAVKYLQDHPDCTGKVGSVGFCFGGGMSIRLAVRIPDLGAAVSFYGRHPQASEASAIQAPLMLHHAGLDERVNAGWPEFELALRAADRAFVNYDYDDVNHGFHNDTTPRYDKDAADLAWQRTMDFFANHLELGD